jgi:hypothetical protein
VIGRATGGIRDAVAQYATRFHRLFDGTHGVASPFGAWLLLALVAPAADRKARGDFAGLLGCEVDDAFEAATRMLAHPHAELVLGAAVWNDPRVETAPLLDFLRTLAAHAEGGPIPSQAEADAWARQRTLGLIERFPVDLDRGDPVVLLLATAIAARVSWQVPFNVIDPSASVLPAAPGFSGVPLLRDAGAAAWSGIVATDAGLLAGYTARSADGLLVTSAVGAAGAAPAAVLDATQRIACAVAARRPPPTVSLFDLELGDHEAWRITERTTTYVGLPERYDVVLPAWQAVSNHDLTRADLGFPAAGAMLVDLLPPRSSDYAVEARQSAMARYTRAGFEAAAVTALAARLTSAPRTEDGPVRTARVEFTRPHAAVATTDGDGDWDGLPVFSAWVAEAVPAS